MASGFKSGRVELDVIQPIFTPGNISTVHRVVLGESEIRTFGLVRDNRHIFMLTAKLGEGIVEGIVSRHHDPAIRAAVHVPSEELAAIHSKMQVGARRFGKKGAKSALLDLLRGSERRFMELEATEPDIFHPDVRMSIDIGRMASDVESGFLRRVKA
ncbi:MAG: hypothetical protein M1160_00095 [Candidatus Marsarchaeota archaeon]|nr:hypothetical protein [Candidatus Marsarchaeota archaeon]MCL5111271.1 hypothetical protein [Candidatus Marsarchaeota archaeon]